MRYSNLIAMAVACATPVVAQNWQNNCQCPMNEGYSYTYLDNCENHYFAEVDYLAWYVDQEGMSYASVYDVASTDFEGTGPRVISAHAADGKDLFFKTKWDSGVRAMVGFKPRCKSWDVRASYTYFSTNDKPRGVTSSATSTLETIDGVTASVKDGTIIIPAYFSVTQPSSSLGSPAETITYSLIPRWKFNFNQADLELSEEFFVTCDATIRFFGGFRGLWTNQKFEEVIALESTITVEDVVEPTLTSLGAFEAQHKFSAFGARAGLDFNYTIGGGFDLYASLAGSILWGWFNDRQSFATTTEITPTTDADNAETFTHSHHTSILNLDTAFGLRWNYWLNCHRHLLTVRFGWEQHIYMNINQFQNFAGTPSVGSSNQTLGSGLTAADHNFERGDLSLSGFVVGLEYAF